MSTIAWIYDHAFIMKNYFNILGLITHMTNTTQVLNL